MNRPHIAQGKFLSAARNYAPHYLRTLSIIIQKQFKLLSPRTPSTNLESRQEDILDAFNALEENRPSLTPSFNLFDDEIVLEVNSTIYTFRTRIIESTHKHGIKNLRLVLWSHLEHLEAKKEDQSKKTFWTPLSKEEHAAAPLEVLKHYTFKFGPFSSILTSSMGTSVFDGLTLLEKEEFELIPKTLIICRGMPSVEKYLKKKHPWIGHILAMLASFFRLDMNGEKALITFLQRAYSNTSTLPARKTVVLIEMSEDTLFSKEGGFDPDFGKKIKQYANLFRGVFTLPTEPKSFHHYAPFDQIINHQGLKGCHTDKFLEMQDLEPLPETLVKHIFNQTDKTGWHTSLLVGGRGSTLDKITLNYALPILESFINNQRKHQ